MTRILLGIGMLTLGVAVAAQGKKEQPTLGAVAKAAQEAKAKSTAEAPVKAKDEVKTTTDASTEKAAAKKYSNEDLDGRPQPSSPTAYRTAVKGAAMVSSSGASGRDESYWRARAQSIRQRLQESTDRLNIAKARLDNLKSDGIDIAVANGRSSPMQAERQRQANYVQELESRVRRDEQALKNLEDEGRKAGALPGWFR